MVAVSIRGKGATRQTSASVARAEVESVKVWAMVAERGGNHHLSPAKLQLLLQNGIAHHRAGRLAEAELSYRQARAAAPKNFDGWQLSGTVAYQLGRIADAVEWLGRAHRLDPRHAIGQMRYGLALLAAKRTDEAEKHLRNAVKVKPGLHEGWDHLAYCLKLQNRLDEAVGCHARVVAVKPDYAVGWYNYGLTLSLAGRFVDALACHDRALAADPNYHFARFGRAQALHQAERIPEALDEYARFIQLVPNQPEARSYRLFALHHVDGIEREALFAEHVAYGRAVGAAPTVEFANEPEPERKLRLAILSPDFRSHSCAYFIAPLLRHLDRAQFDLYLYHDHFLEDAMTARLRKMATVWRNFVSQPGPAVEKVIRDDAPDILIDLSGHVGMTSRLPLFARRLAPVQVTYLGYPDTTGVPAMDYRLTDALADPPGEADAFATEKLLRFAPTAWAYEPPPNSPEVEPPPCTRCGHVTFGSFNTLGKITDRVLALWGRVLQAVPNARLVVKGRGLETPGVAARYQERLARCGLPVDRVDLVGRTAETNEHLALYGRVDVALDTFPYHGTTTTCEALWMGVPVVSLFGAHHMSRVGVSLLNAAGHPEWAVADEAAYVRIATELAGDPERLVGVRAALRNDLRRGPLLDHAVQSARFGECLRDCWRNWCAPATAASVRFS